MASQVERQEMIATIKRLPAALESALAGLNDTQLNTPYGPGKWTLRQVAHHLADSHAHAYIRTKLILLEDNVTVKPYDQDVWALTIYSQTLSPDLSIAILRGIHARWTTVFDSLNDTHWARNANHPERGTISLDDILALYSHHGENHVGQTLALRKAKGW